MKHLSISIILLLVFAFASCSQEDMPDAAKSGLVTIEARLNKTMTSRAVTDDSDELPSKAYLWYRQADEADAAWNKEEATVLADNAFNFNVELDKTRTYDILVWADNGGYDVAEPTEISALTDGDAPAPSIAFSGNMLGFKPTGNEATVTLKHTVAKLMVVETGTLSANDRAIVEFDVKQYSYNAFTETYTAVASSEARKVTLEKTATATENNSGTLFSYYYLVPAAGAGSTEPQDVDLTYYRAGKDRTCKKTLTSVPFHANRRTVITGSFKNLDQYADLSFNVTTDDNWEEGTVEKFPLHYNKATDGDLRTFLSINASAATDAVLYYEGDMEVSDFGALKEFLSPEGEGADALLTLDLSAAKIKGNTIPDQAFGSFATPETKAAIGLKKVILPSEVTTVNSSAFNGCNNLESINLENIVTINNCAFRYCTSLRSIDLSNVVKMDSYTFADCSSLENVVFPAESLWLGGSEFENTALSGELVMPDSWRSTSPGGFTFSNTNITLLSIPSNYPTTQLFCKMPELETIVMRGEVVIKRNSINNCPKLKTIDFSMATSLPEFSDNADGNSAFFFTKSNVTILVKDEAMKAEFAQDAKWSAAGFKPEQFVVKE